MVLRIELIGDKVLSARLAAFPTTANSALVKKLNQLTLALKRKVQLEFLSGPTGAHTLSVGPNTPGHTGGQLRRSVFSRVDLPSSGPRGTVGYGADTPYAAIHEYGGTIQIPEIVPVKARVLHWVDKSGLDVFVKKVRAHSVTIPERAPLRTAFKEMLPEIEVGMKEAILESLRAVKG